MTFDYAEWSAMTDQMPRENVGDALRAVLDRKNYFDSLPALNTAANERAREYHAAVPAEEIDGVPVWSAPVASFAAYPSGYQVHHEGEVWVQVSETVVMGEPGVDPAWVQRPEPESPAGEPAGEVSASE